MVNRLGANLNNPFDSAGRPAVRNLHLKTTESVNDRVKNLKNKSDRKQGKFGELVRGEIVDAEIRRPKQRQQEKQFTQDPRFGSAQDMARKMQFERARSASQSSTPQMTETVSRQEFEQLKTEMKHMRSDLNRLMVAKEPETQSKQGFAKPSSINIGFGTGYEIGNA